MSEKTKNFINEHWNDCVRENRNDNGTLLGLPYPYTVPAVGKFEEIYYWDTYFTNKGLEISERFDLAKSNTDNMLYLVSEYGFMPNGNRTYYLNRSQPPFLSEMVRGVYEHYRDKAWLAGAFEALKKEYNFWMTERITPIGLNQYDVNCSDEELENAGKGFMERVSAQIDGDIKMLGKHCLLTCESGWDMNPRWDFEGYSYVQVDLNSLMYMLEKNMAYFSAELGAGEEILWNERAVLRRERMIKYMEDENGLLLDYNFVTGERSRVFSAASLYPLFAGLAESRHAKAAADNLSRLEAKYGVLTCEKGDKTANYQWDYPNGWACLQYVAVIGFDKYGYTDIAHRLAEKYTSLIEKCFDETGNLWEKYNVTDGSLNVSNEYAMPTMMGWSAGVYLAAEKYLNDTDKSNS